MRRSPTTHAHWGARESKAREKEKSEINSHLFCRTQFARLRVAPVRPPSLPCPSPGRRNSAQPAHTAPLPLPHHLHLPRPSLAPSPSPVNGRAPPDADARCPARRASSCRARRAPATFHPRTGWAGIGALAGRIACPPDPSAHPPGPPLFDIPAARGRERGAFRVFVFVCGGGTPRTRRCRLAHYG